jgi:site-specific DNA-methyltransferase (adenine-specific)
MGKRNIIKNMKNITVEEKNIDELRLDFGNPRKIKKADMESLKISLAAFDDFGIIVVNDYNQVIAGNQRIQAMKEMGWAKPILCKVLTGFTDQELMAVNIRANKNSGVFDEIILSEWIKDIELSLVVPVELTGLSPIELRDLNPTVSKEDDFEIPNEVETDIQLGDLFQIGEHRLLCGDSTDAGSAVILMDGKHADMVFTDPPYGVAIGEKNRMLNSFQKAGRNLTDIESDSKTPDELYQVLLPAFKNIKSNMAEDCTVFVTSPQGGGLGMMMMMMMKEAGLEIRHVLIWKKNCPTFSMGRLDYDYQHEPILLTWGKKHNYYGLGKHRTSVWEIDKPMACKEHPTMKPIALIENALLNNSKEHDIIIDFFLGSGTTMVAAHQLGRKCYGIELAPKYCQVIIDRMKKLDPDIKIERVNNLG